MKILLVEDEEMLNGITAKYLRAENMTVDTCFNGQQAIDYVNTSSYDVIVMDIMMPILDGISALAQMRNDGNTTPVLLLTAKDSLQDKVTGLNTGADDYLVKPFDLEELTARIYALARRNARHAQNDIHVGPLTINVPQRTVKRDGETITLTAKEKICFCEETICNPDACPYAKGHFDRVNAAVYELLTSTDEMSREVLEEQARKWNVCPFEMALDVSQWVDAVICDYNYAVSYTHLTLPTNSRV